MRLGVVLGFLVFNVPFRNIGLSRNLRLSRDAKYLILGVLCECAREICIYTSEFPIFMMK